jgi:hypothetical protein
MEEQGVAGHDFPSGQQDRFQVAVGIDDQANDLPLADLDVQLRETIALLARKTCGPVREHDQVAAPAQQLAREVESLLAAGVERQWLIGNFPSVAVGTVEGSPSPELEEPVERRQDVADAGGEQKLPGLGPVAALEQDPESLLRSFGPGHALLAKGHVVGGELVPANAQELCRRRAVPGEHVVRRLGDGIAGRAVRGDEHAAA